jgi:PIN domain nuclease of toxin-antitoxin system
MAKYFLDTHIFYWFLNNDDRLDKNIREGIANPKPKEQYVVSDFVMLELVQLKQLNKITCPKGLQGIMDLMTDYNIGCEVLDYTVWFKLDEIPIQKINNTIHSDPFDRIMLAHCIQYRYTMISADKKFPHYRKFGLHLIEV